MCDLCRRNFLRGVSAAGVSGLFASVNLTQSIDSAYAEGAVPRLPPRGEFVIRNAHVMTMEASVGDIAGGSVHVKNGEIVAIGKDVNAPAARVINGDGMIVLPGLVDTHWHMWNTLFRSFAGDEAANGYFPTVARFGANMTPLDMYQSARLSAAEAINSGMTTVHDWCHNVRSKEYAEQDLRALKESGLRARFSYGWSQGQDDKQPMDIAGLESVHRDWKNHSNEGLLTLGLAQRSMFRTSFLPEAVYKAEFEAARKMGIPITIHVGQRKEPPELIATHYKAGLLGKDVQIIHAVWATADEIKMMKETGTAVSIATTSELRIGFGLPPVTDFLAAGIPTGVSVDTSALVGSSSLFQVIRDVRDAENARTLSEFKLPARRALELGTIEGARSLGIGDKVGSLKVGKRADIIMVNTRALNMGAFIDPAHLLIGSAMPENIDTVVVDGRILKAGGKLTAMNVPQVVAEARAAVDGIRKRTNWR